MPVKAIIVRRVPQPASEILKPLLVELRSRAIQQSGYISGETLLRVDDPEEHLVISTWDSLENWNKWLNDPRRIDVQKKIDEILGSETLYQVYFHS